MNARGWKPMNGFPIAVLAVVLVIARGCLSQGGSTATATEVSGKHSTPFEAAATAEPTTNALTSVEATSGLHPEEIPVGVTTSPPSPGRRHRRGVFPSWLRNYDVYDELAALYGVNPVQRGSRAAAVERKPIIARHRPRQAAPSAGLEAGLRKPRKRRRKQQRETADQSLEAVKPEKRKYSSEESSSPRQKKKRKVKRGRKKKEDKVDSAKSLLVGPGKRNDSKPYEGNVKEELGEGDTQNMPSIESTSDMDLSTPASSAETESESMEDAMSFTMQSMMRDTSTEMPSSEEESTESLLDSLKMGDLMSSLEMTTTEDPDMSTMSSLEDFSFGDMDQLEDHISKFSKDGSDLVEKRKKKPETSPSRPPLRVSHPEHLSQLDIVHMINADLEDVVMEDRKEMASLAREDDQESRSLSDENDEEDAQLLQDPDEEEESELRDKAGVKDTSEEEEEEAGASEKQEVTTDGPDETEVRERHRVSEHEDPPEPPTRPNYTHEGLWAKPPPHVHIDFVPLQILTQVRRYDTVKHLTPEDALAEATTDEEVANAPRLKEVVSHRKTSEVYSEEGYEDSGYDHGGYNKEGEHHEVVPGFEASAIMIKNPDDEEVSESRHRDHAAAGSQQRGTRLVAPGVPAGGDDVPGKDHTRHGSKETTRGSWSITQVSQVRRGTGNVG